MPSRRGSTLVEVRGGTEDLARIRRSLDKAGRKGRGIEKRLRRRLASEVAKTEPAVRQGIVTSRARGSKSTGLRRRIADTTTVTKGRRGISSAIGLDGRKMPTGQRALPAYHEGAKRRWRHPVHGNKNVWVQQKSAPSFNRTMRRERNRVDRALLDEAQKIADDLNRAH